MDDAKLEEHIQALNDAVEALRVFATDLNAAVDELRLALEAYATKFEEIRGE
jgi:hypothetical protein